MRATVPQAAILVGALDSHAGALTEQVPKPLLPVAGRPFLGWLLRELCRWGVERVLLLAACRADAMHAALPGLAATLPRPLDIEVLEEPRRAGTGGALFHARDRLDARFLLLNGDSVFDTNLGRLLADAARDGPDVAARMLRRRTGDADRFGAAINAGIAVAGPALLEAVAAGCSLETDVYPRLAAAGTLRSTEASGWFIDIGVPADFCRAQHEVPKYLGARRALILDRDGVLNVDHGYVGTRDRFEWVPGAVQAVCEACDAGWHVFVATNQSGVARGRFAEVDVQVLHTWLADVVRAAGGTIDDFRYCPHHEAAIVPRYAAACSWRKPAPGMLLDLLRAWQIPADRSVMVGDAPRDMQAAAAAGMAGHLFPGGNLAEFVTAIRSGRTA